MERLVEDYKAELYDPEKPEEKTDIMQYIDVYRLFGGTEQPIRYVIFSISKKTMDEIGININDIMISGRTILRLEAVGSGTFVISKITLEQYAYKIIAFGIEIKSKSSVISGYENVGLIDIVKSIANTIEDGNGNSYNIGDNIVVTQSIPNTPITLLSGMNSFYALQLCALIGNGYIFFGEKEIEESGVKKSVDCIYFVNYDDINPIAYNPGAGNEINGVVNVYPGINHYYDTYTANDVFMLEKVIRLSEQNEQGSETIINRQELKYTIKPDNTPEYQKTIVGTYQPSISTYGIHDGNKINAKKLVLNANNEQIATDICNNVIKRYKDPSRTIIIRMNESIEDGIKWSNAFEEFSYARKINDTVNQIFLKNVHFCDDIEDNAILRMSIFCRMYPENTSEYRFGVVKQTDLTQDLADMQRYEIDGDGGTSGEATIDDILNPNSTNAVMNKVLYNKFIDIENLIATKQDTMNATSPIVINNNNISHANSGISAGTYPNSDNRGYKIPQFTIDEKGHITAYQDAYVNDSWIRIWRGNATTTGTTNNMYSYIDNTVSQVMIVAKSSTDSNYGLVTTIMPIEYFSDGTRSFQPGNNVLSTLDAWNTLTVSTDDGTSNSYTATVQFTTTHQFILKNVSRSIVVGVYVKKQNVR